MTSVKIWKPEAADGRDYMMTMRSGGDGGVPSSRGENIVMEREYTIDGPDEPLSVYQNQQGRLSESDVFGTLILPGGSIGQGYKCVRTGRKLRRLMPVECERLHGFPDDWTKTGVDADGGVVEVSDSARYRMMGNAASVNVCGFMVGNILEVLKEIDEETSDDGK